MAHREELEKGIAVEAFKTLPGDDKEVASALLKQNKAERKERDTTGTQLKTEFETSVQGNVQEAMADYGNFLKLPERTPEEVEAKQRAYQKFLNGKGYTFLKTMADTQVAQFFIPKTQANKDRLMTDAEFRQILRGYKSWQSPKTSYALVHAQEQRFFHWFLEFPEVFQQGGFDCILGNPPFLGGQKLTSTYGDNFLEFIKYEFAPIGAVDLVTYFFRRIFGIIKPNGFQSLISTNTIAQGSAREGGLDVIIKQGGTINHAVKSMKWPGKAAVEVALITLTKQAWKGKFILAGKEVRTITPYLDNAETIGNPLVLKQNEGKSFQGSIVLGKGFILSPNEAEDLIKKNSIYKNVLFPYLNGEDLNNNYDQSASRWVINFFNWPLSSEEDSTKPPKGPPYARDFPDCIEIVEKLAKPERIAMKGDRGAQYWWQFLRMRGELYNSIAPLEKVLVITRVTKTHALDFQQKQTVFSDATVVFAFDQFSKFAIMQSSFHEYWSWSYSSTMKGDRRYAPTDCFETFPFPKSQILEQEQLLKQRGEQYYEYRRQLMISYKLGLTKTYNFFNTQYLTSVDIEKQSKQPREVCEKAQLDIFKLRELHVQMDQAVLEAYGWQDIQLRHNFYPVDYLPENDRVRYTIHPEARKEILKRLLELNHKIHEEEVKAGVLDKKKPEKVKKKVRPPVFNEQQSLFSDKFEKMVEFDLDTGIYTTRDAAEITGLSIEKVRRWFKELSAASYEGLEGDGNSDTDRLKISFHGLIELVVIGTLRDNRFSLQKILTAREDLKSKTEKGYPFATIGIKKIKVAGKSIIFESPSGPITLDGSGQLNLAIIREFFKHIKFNIEGLAEKLFPPTGKGKIVVDPKIAQGKPVIAGKSVWAETIAKMYTGPDSISLLKDQYNLLEDEILAAVEYCKG